MDRTIVLPYEPTTSPTSFSKGYRELRGWSLLLLAAAELLELLYIHICTQAGYYWLGEIYLFCTTTIIIILHMHVTIELPILQLISAPYELIATMHFGGTTVLSHVPPKVALPFRSRPATGKRTRLPISGLRHLPSSVCLLPCAYHAASTGRFRWHPRGA